MESFDELISGSDNLNFCLAKPDYTYVIYLAEGGESTLNLTGSTGNYTVKWFDPRNGGELLTGSILEIEAGNNVSLGMPPNETNSDWVVLIEKIETVPDVAVTGITINQTELSLEEGTSQIVTYTIMPSQRILMSSGPLMTRQLLR